MSGEGGDWRRGLGDSGRGYFTLQTDETGEVPVRLFLTEKLLAETEDSIYPQIVNATRFPGVRLVVITPDVHHGYGVPIGTALLTDADAGAVAMGPVGYDIGCFTGDTLVPTLDGHSYSLRDLARRGGVQWVYALSPEHRIVAAEATASLTRRDAPLVRVVLDTGGHVVCTPDHLFMRRDGTWCQAGELSVGASLMPFYRKEARGQYRIVKHPATDSGQAVHWILARQGLLGPIPGFDPLKTVVHHKNFSPLDDSLENLEFMGDRDHVRFQHRNGRHSYELHRAAREPARIAALGSGFGIHNHRRSEHGYNHKVVRVEALDRTEDVYCLRVPTYGNFALDVGVFVHNCGMMSAASDVPVDAATPENRRRFNQEVTRRIALGPGKVSRTRLKALTPRDFEAIIRGGAAHYLDRYGSAVDRTNTERDVIPVGDDWRPPWGGPGRPERGIPQLGTLGGGNHFIELQENLGTHTLYVQLHSGSRGFGHGLATHYFHLARAENRAVRALDLGYFTPDSRHYRDYLNAVAAGANFAIVNRLVMFEQIALAFEEVFRASLRLVYEISHNLVQREQHPEFGWVHVHRKGATRAFPGGHGALAGTPWADRGHPILIPGSNRDSSFILRALPGASVSGYSVNHGAGRRMSRTAARRAFTQAEVDAAYRDAGVLVNLDGVVPIDESKDAYKPVREVVAAVERAGLAAIEHELRPLASIKGNE